MKKKILVIGHPKCGTGYVAQLLTNMGFEIGHEKMEKDGVSSWMMAVEDNNYPFPTTNPKDYDFEHIFYVIRHPLDAIQTIKHIENTNEKSLKFREKHLNKKLSKGFQGAAESYIGWYNMALKHTPNIKIINVENSWDSLAKYFNKQNFKIPPNNINTRRYRYKKLSSLEVLNSLKRKTQKQVIEIINNYYGGKL